MDFSKDTIGFGITGSFCTHEKIKKEIQHLVDLGAKVIPVFSEQVQKTDTRFGKAEDFLHQVEEMTGCPGIYTIAQAEPIGPKALLDVMVIAPCTGNTLAKLAAGITDTPVLMAAKAHMRNQRPLVIAISTNDALAMNFKNIGTLMHMKNIFFVPFGQDDFEKKPCSMIARTELLGETIAAAMEGRQLQPVLI
jgi:dipicolinate synthase subunit B